VANWFLSLTLKAVGDMKKPIIAKRKALGLGK